MELEKMVRTEKLSMRVTIPGEDYQEAKGLVDTVLGRSVSDVRLDDILNVDYAILIDYVGDVANRLSAVIRLREMGIPVHVNIQELTDGRCLFAEVVQHLDTILEKP